MSATVSWSTVLSFLKIDGSQEGNLQPLLTAAMHDISCRTADFISLLILPVFDINLILTQTEVRRLY
jgi:hypothetical protein